MGNENSLPLRLFKMRSSLGLTQEEFAKRLGISRKTLSNIELGRSAPDPVLSKIISQLNIDMVSTFGGLSNHLSPKPAARTSVFVSYSHRDKRWLDRLHTHVAPLVRAGTINCWDDTRIRASQDWRAEINSALREAKVAVFLVSADFLASEFIANNELPPLLQAAENEGASILSVILSPCGFLHCPLAKYQAVNPPDKPLSALRNHNRESIWQRVTLAIQTEMQPNSG